MEIPLSDLFSRRSAYVLGLAVALAAAFAPASSATSNAASTSAGPGTLAVQVTGLPPAARPVGNVRGPGVSRQLRSQRLTLKRAAAGRYVISLRPTTLRRGWRAARKGARVLPLKARVVVRVSAGRKAVAAVTYGTIVNPGVRRAPSRLVKVEGDPSNPTRLVYRDGAGLPKPGAIITAAPSAQLPNGLVVKVVDSDRRGAQRVLTVRPVPITSAVPAFDFRGDLKLKLASFGDASARAAATSCSGPDRFDAGAKLDEFTVRRASAKLFRPQMSFTLAVRTTEWFGARAAVAGLSCKWTIAELGPWHGAIPTPIGIPIPVYARIPVDLSASVEGQLSAFKLNVASTSVLDLDLGSYNRFDLRQEGTNVWIDNVLRFSGSSSIGATLSLEMGVGSSKIADFHARAGFGPKATWRSGRGCSVDLEIGSLSVGAKIGPLKAGTPPFSPFSVNLWRGCQTGEEVATPPKTATPAVHFDGSPGIEAPPPTLGPYSMTPFPSDPRDVLDTVSDVPGPTGTLVFDTPLTHHFANDTWQTWSHGYAGDAYSTGGTDIVLTLPPGTGAAYLYAEPNVFDLFTVAATSQDGTTSGPIDVEGEAGARYFGFYATCGATLDTIHVTAAAEAGGFAIGEFGIAPITGGSSPCP